MAETYSKILLSGTQAAYDALSTKDSNCLYFCTDSGKIYKGTVDFSNSVIAAGTKPTAPVLGKIYILADTNTVEYYNGSAWVVLSYPVATTVDVSSDDVHVASAKAVYDAIQQAVSDVTGGSTVVASVAAGTSAATVKVTKGDGTSTTVTVPKVVTTPTWDSSTRKLTLPVSDGTSVEVNIGKDIFVDSTKDNKYNPTTGNIELYLNDGTLISIPASDLVDTYTGTTANGTSVAVSDDNKISVNLVVDPSTSNGLTVSSSGILVNLSAYAKTADVNSQISAVQTSLDAVKATADQNKTDIATLNGSASTAGSVAYQVATAKTALESADTALSNRITTLETANTTNTAAIATNTANIAALAEATTEWGTF